MSRATVSFNLRIIPQAVAKAKADAAASGYKTLRFYVEALIEAGLPRGWIGRPEQFAAAVPATMPVILGHRVTQALEAVRDRIDAGESDESLLPDLQAMRGDVAETLALIRRQYLAEVDAHDARIAL